MTEPVSEFATECLRRLGGDSEAAEPLFLQVYEELRRLAQGQLRRERVDHTLQPTALVNEAYLKLVRQDSSKWTSRAHFLALSAEIMRRILVDHSRIKQAAKRDGGQRVTLGDAVAGFEEELDLSQLDHALQKLAKVGPRQAKVVEMRFFGGMSVPETAEVLEVSPGTVKGDWKFARAWLQRELEAAEGD